MRHSDGSNQGCFVVLSCESVRRLRSVWTDRNMQPSASCLRQQRQQCSVGKPCWEFLWPQAAPHRPLRLSQPAIKEQVFFPLEWPAVANYTSLRVCVLGGGGWGRGEGGGRHLVRSHCFVSEEWAQRGKLGCEEIMRAAQLDDGLWKSLMAYCSWWKRQNPFNPQNTLKFPFKFLWFSKSRASFQTQIPARRVDVLHFKPRLRCDFRVSVAVKVIGRFKVKTCQLSSPGSTKKIPSFYLLKNSGMFCLHVQTSKSRSGTEASNNSPSILRPPPRDSRDESSCFHVTLVLK